MGVEATLVFDGREFHAATDEADSEKAATIAVSVVLSLFKAFIAEAKSLDAPEPTPEDAAFG